MYRCSQHSVGRAQHPKNPNLDRRGKAMKCNAAGYKNKEVQEDMKQARSSHRDTSVFGTSATWHTAACYWNCPWTSA